MNTLADIIRTFRGPNVSKSTLKSQRARLRRLGLTDKTSRVHGPYAVDPTSLVPTDRRADAGVIIVASVAEGAL